MIRPHIKRKTHDLWPGKWQCQSTEASGFIVGAGDTPADAYEDWLSSRWHSWKQYSGRALLGLLPEVYGAA